MRDWRETCQGGRLFASDLTRFRHLGDQHRAGDWADPWNGSQDGGGFGQYPQIIDRDGFSNNPLMNISAMVTSQV